jgi:hypothetical protein
LREERRKRNFLIGRHSARLTRIGKTLDRIGKEISECLKSSKSTENPLPKDPTPAEIILSLLRFNADGKCSNAFEVISSVQVLKLAYETIKSKPGNMVRGVTPETLDGISLE